MPQLLSQCLRAADGLQLLKALETVLCNKRSHCNASPGTTARQLPCSVVRNLPANAGNLGLIPGSGRSPGGGHGNLLQYSCLENSTDRGAWQAIVHRDTKSWTWLKWLSMHAHHDKYLSMPHDLIFKKQAILPFFFFNNYMRVILERADIHLLRRQIQPQGKTLWISPHDPSWHDHKTTGYKLIFLLWLQWSMKNFFSLGNSFFHFSLENLGAC